MTRRRGRRWAFLAIATIVFVVLIANQSWWQAAFHFLFPQETEVMYPSAGLILLVWQHIQLVIVSSAITVAMGVPLGIWVTRPTGRDFLPIVSDITSLGQTFPPVAVLALAVPMLGFGAVPTVVALFLYGLLPVVRNTVAGIRSVPPYVVDAARGLGMNRRQTLLKVEFPLSLPVILAGIRISVIINIGTAMIGAVIGAGGLGAPIVAGLVRNDLAFILEGAIPAAMLAVLADRLLVNIEDGLVVGTAS